MIYQFPDPNKNYTWYQGNIGDSEKSGNIWSSFNLDLMTNRSVMRLGGRMILNKSTTDLATMTSVPISFCEFDGYIWTIAGGRIFRASSGYPSGSFAADTSTGAVTTYDSEVSDLAVFDGKLWASNDDGWYTKTTATGAWSVTTATPNAGITQYFRRTDHLYIVQSSDNVDSVDDAGTYYSTAGQYSISLTQATDNAIQCMDETTDSLWLGTSNNKSKTYRATIFRWDGIAAQANERYLLKAHAALAMCVRDDIPYVMDSNGVLSKFTGSSFEEVGRLPLFNGSGANDFPGNSDIMTNPQFIQHNGMVVTKSGTIECLVRNIYEDSGITYPENMASGIWEWSEEFGFVHKHSLSYTPISSTTITDWGQQRLWDVGALALADFADDSSSRNGTLLAGAEYALDNDNNGTAQFGIWYDDYRNFVQKKGYFVTTWIDTTEVQSKWERLWSVYKRFSASTDSIICKYRLVEEDATLADITWVDTTTFTTSTNITAYGPTATGFNGTTGGEVEFIQGVGSGLCAHITNVTGSGPYTVTIDETATGATTTTGKARFQKWIKLHNAVPQDQVVSYSQMGIGQSSPTIQLKCCMTFTGTNEELQKLALVSNEDIKISP